MKNSKKILVGVLNDGTGGVDSYIYNLCRLFSSKGYYVDVLTSRLCENITNKFKNVTNNIIKVPRLTEPLRIFSVFDSLNKHNHYDLFYMNVSSSLMYPYLKSAKKAGICKIITHSHACAIDEDGMFKNIIFRLAHVLYKKKLVSLSTILFACSNASARWTFGKYIGNSKCVIIPNPIDVCACKYNEDNRKAIRKNLDLNERFALGCISGFRPQKNVKFTIDVAHELASIDDDIILLLIGSGPQKEEIETYAKRYLPARNYKFLGERNDVPELLSAIDCFLFPSLSEGLGMSLLEAQASDLDCYINKNLGSEAIIEKLKNVHRLSLSSSKMWAEEIWKNKNKNKARDPKSYIEVKKAGYHKDSLNKVLEYIED